MKPLFPRPPGLKILRNELLRRHTTFRIGGKAYYYIKVYSWQKLLDVLRIIGKRKLRYFIIGAGSNVLFGDNGYHGAVVQLCGAFNRIYEDKIGRAHV